MVLLMNKQEAAVKLQEKIDNATTELEKAFEALQEMKDFARSECDNGDWYYGDLEQEGLVTFYGLTKIMDDNGWSSSSLWC